MTTTRPSGFTNRIAGAPRPRRPLPNTRASNILHIAKYAVGLPLMPLWPIFMSIVAKDAYYVNHYFETLWHVIRTMRNAWRNRSWGRIFKYNVWKTPLEIEEALGSRMGACTRCAKCCKMLQCDYLAYDKGSHEYFCSVYNTPFWIFGDCGRYPIDQQDIDDYNCPGFAFPESVAAAEGRPAGGLIQIKRL
jgi:hypothetical protein